MNLKKISAGITILAVSFLFCPLTDGAAGGEGMRFSVVPDKTEYEKGDPVMIDFRLKNIGDKPVYVNKRFYVNSPDSPAKHREVEITLISPEGKQLDYRKTYTTGLPKSDYFELLGPGEEIVLERKRHLKSYFDIKAPGTYRLSATYKNSCGGEIGLDVFSDRLESETVEINIKE